MTISGSCLDTCVDLGTALTGIVELKKSVVAIVDNSELSGLRNQDATEAH